MQYPPTAPRPYLRFALGSGSAREVCTGVCTARTRVPARSFTEHEATHNRRGEATARTEGEAVAGRFQTIALTEGASASTKSLRIALTARTTARFGVDDDANGREEAHVHSHPRDSEEPCPGYPSPGDPATAIQHRL